MDKIPEDKNVYLFFGSYRYNPPNEANFFFVVCPKKFNWHKKFYPALMRFLKARLNVPEYVKNRNGETERALVWNGEWYDNKQANIFFSNDLQRPFPRLWLNFDGQEITILMEKNNENQKTDNNEAPGQETDRDQDD